MGNTLIFLIAFFGVLAVVLGWNIRRITADRKLFKTLAERWGLSYSSGGLLYSPEVRGTLDGFPVHVFKQKFSHGRYATYKIGFSVKYPGLPGSLKIRAQGFFGRLMELGGERDIKFNDGSFDKAVMVEGDVHKVRALLNPRAREIISWLIKSAYNKHFTLAYGTLETCQEAGWFKDEEDLSQVFKPLIEFGKLLTRPGRTNTLLRDNFLAERDPNARAAYLESIIATSPEPLAEDDEVIRAASASGDPPLMFQAARALGPAGDRRLPGIFTSASHQLALRVLEHAKDRKAYALAPEFIKLTDFIKDWEVKAAVVRFLAASGNSEVEAWLCGELEAGSGAPVDYRRECVRALSECGGRPSLEVLHQLSGPSSRGEIDSAIAAILKRLGITETGWLSRAENESGKGDLSLTDERDG